ncbi:MAG: single-stranded DNA-binding protein [Ardenticatenia bacterium]|nr:single-stranded DNA-binding protein [Ardenticatenia bacterium]
MYHRIIIIGNLGTDPELRFTPQGTPVAHFNVATNREWTNQDGTKGKETIWWRISAWGRLGETCNQFLSKGRQVYIEGELVPDPQTGGPRIWYDQNGQPRASFEVRARTVKFLGTRGSVEGEEFTEHRGGAPRRSTTVSPTPSEPEEEFGPDEIPF